MPSLNEGSFLLMPTSMPHSSIEKNLEYIETLDKRLSAIPEVEIAVGKWGRVNSALDPAPIQMFENTINYRSEYILDENGHRQRFKVDDDGYFVLDMEKVRKRIEINGNKIDIDSIREISFEHSDRLFHFVVNDKLNEVSADVQSDSTISIYFNLFQTISISF